MTITDSVNSEIKVTALVVTYNPDIQILRQLLQKLAGQTDSIVVVDNNSRDSAAINEVCADCKLFLLPVNLGLGKAHNLGIEYAKSTNCTHILILDQDSTPLDNMVTELNQTATELESKGIRYSGIGCRYHLGESGQASNFVKISWFRFSRVQCQHNSYTEADFLISSGTMIPVKVLDDVGMMDESLFIDHIDTEWFLRAKHLGYRAYGCCNAFMQHALGERTVKIWFGRNRQVPFHHPFRYYYIFRNSFLLYKRGYMSFKWMVADWVRLIQNFVFFGLMSNQRFSNLKMMALGIVHGIKGVAGRNDDLIFRDG